MTMFRVSTLALGLIFLSGCDSGAPDTAAAEGEQAVPVEAPVIAPHP
ncbi:hypothetical protein ACTACT_10360 [Pseudomonas syringae]